MTFSIGLENRFGTSQRDIRVRRKSRKETLEEQRVSYPAYEYGEGEEEKSAASFSLGSMEGEEDYLEISVGDEQADLGPCKIELPANVPFRFIPGGITSIAVFPPKNRGAVTLLRIPSGPPTWKLEIMRPPEPASDEEDTESVLISRADEGSMPDVTVGDDQPGGWV